MSKPLFLIYDNEHRAWRLRKPKGAYQFTQIIDFAGRYTYEEAKQIVADATVDGCWKVPEVQPNTGQRVNVHPVVMVPAPESLPLIAWKVTSDAS